MALEQIETSASPLYLRSSERSTENGRSAAAPQRRRRHAYYRRLVVCLSASDASARACETACVLAADRGSTITAIAAIEVSLDTPLGSVDAATATAARDAVYTAHAVADRYGISLDGVVLRAHGAGEAIVAEVTARRAQLVVVPAAWPQGKHDDYLPATAGYVLKHAPCRVMLIGRQAEAPSGSQDGGLDTVFHAGRASDYWPTGRFVDREERDASRRSDGNQRRAP